MKQKAFIFGISDLAELLFSYLREDSRYDVLGFVVDQEYLCRREFCDRPVYSFFEVENKYIEKKDEIGFFVCVGYKKMNLIRYDIINRIKAIGFDILTYIHPSALIYSSDIGKGNLIFPNVMIDKLVSVGNYNILYSGASIAHHTIVGDYNFFAVKCCVCGHIRIGNNCFIGANSTIKNGICIKDFTLVGGSCFVKNDTEPYCVYVPQNTVKLVGKNSLDFFS